MATCYWKPEFFYSLIDGYDIYGLDFATECGEKYWSETSPERVYDDGFNFCPYCGNELTFDVDDLKSVDTRFGKEDITDKIH